METSDEAVEDARSENDRLLRDLQEANERLILASIRAQELAESTEEARHQLERSEHELRDVAGFRERLIGIVGHDLRNPLSAIWGAMEMLAADGNLDARGTRLVERARQSTRRMASMIAQLLDFTRVHVGGGLPLMPKPTDLADLICQIVDELELGHSMPDGFVCDFQGDLTGDWDPDRLAQVISNLGDNAISHGRAGAPIVIRARDEGEHVLLEVSNEGEAIPAAVLRFIFDPFRRARQSTKSGGLGLGLYISHQIVLAHGGTIDVRSTATEGTTFSVRLPRHPATAGVV